MPVSADTVLDALGDPTRRRILERLSNGPVAVGALAEQLPVSRPAVSQHLRVLKDAGLVVQHAVGTRRLYRIDQAGLAAVRGYVDGFWTTALGSFARAADQQSRSNGASPP